MKTWIKLYTEVIHDRKLWKLKPIEQLTFFYLCTLAGIEDDGGRLPDVEDIELELQMPLKLKKGELDGILSRLEELGLIGTDETGVRTVSNFEKRQMSSLTEAERKAAQRDKSRTTSGQKSGQDIPEMSGQCPDTCPDDVPEMSRLEEEVEEEVEVDKELKRESREKAPARADQKHRRGIWKQVLLTDAEVGKLAERFPDYKRKIQNLDDYLHNNPKKHYADHYLTICKWASEDAAPKQPAPQPQRRESWTEIAERMAAEEAKS